MDNERACSPRPRRCRRRTCCARLAAGRPCRPRGRRAVRTAASLAGAPCATGRSRTTAPRGLRPDSMTHVPDEDRQQTPAVGRDTGYTQCQSYLQVERNFVEMSVSVKGPNGGGIVRWDFAKLTHRSMGATAGGIRGNTVTGSVASAAGSPSASRQATWTVQNTSALP
jgi:hypothetical protein